MLEVRDEFPQHDLVKSTSGLCGYAGGKGRLVGYIQYLSYLRRTETFIDLCAGSGAVSLNIDAPNKILNDISVLVTIVHKALSDDKICKMLMNKIRKTEYAEECYSSALEYWKAHEKSRLDDFSEEEVLNAAYYSWILLRFNRIGNKINFESSVLPDFESAKKQTEYRKFKEKLESYYKKLSGAKVFNEDIFDFLAYLIDNKDNIPKGTTLYIDPPYLSGKDNNFKTKLDTYKNDALSVPFDLNKHKEMLRLAEELPRDKCSIIISNYWNDTYDDVLKSNAFGIWQRTLVKTLAVNCGFTPEGKRYEGHEYFYTNFKF